jgi:hypothetical protein
MLLVLIANSPFARADYRQRSPQPQCYFTPVKKAAVDKENSLMG